jgi:hypothetical protein
MLPFFVTHACCYLLSLVSTQCFASPSGDSSFFAYDFSLLSTIHDSLHFYIRIVVSCVSTKTNCIMLPIFLILKPFYLIIYVLHSNILICSTHLCTDFMIDRPLPPGNPLLTDVQSIHTFHWW